MSDKLPVVGQGRATSAGSTAFVAARVEGPGGYLNVDGNQKVSGWDNPVPNAFSLLAGNAEDPLAPGHERHHCPGSTATCRSVCYVHGLEKHAGTTYDLYRHNSIKVREVIEDRANYWAWVDALSHYARENCAETGFRWHVSGDIFSSRYACFIGDVCAAARPVDFWIYTRSFEYMDLMMDVATVRGGNLAVNLSCDRDNYEAAKLARASYTFGGHGPRLCYLTLDGVVPDDLPPGSVVFPDYSLRGKAGEPMPTWLGPLPAHTRKGVCPTDLLGKSERRRCGRDACDMCLT